MFGAAGENFGRRFVLADLVPAAVLWAALIIMSSLNWLLSQQDVALLDRIVERLGGKTVALSSVIFLTAVFINQLNRMFTRIFEGYWVHALGVFGLLAGLVGLVASLIWEVHSTVPPSLAAATMFGVLCAGLSLGQRLRLERYVTTYDALERRWQAEPHTRDKFLLEHDLAYQFPRDRERVLPTRFGNTYRAAEYYPRYMFNIDAITMWPRLLAVVPAEYARTLDEAESGVAFAVNMCVVSIALALCCFYAGFRAGWVIAPWTSVVICAGAALGFYQLACAAVAGWADCIRSAFDLYRIDLLEKLRIEWPADRLTIDGERDLWRKIGRIVFYNHRPDKAEDFVVKRLTKSNASPGRPE